MKTKNSKFSTGDESVFSGKIQHGSHLLWIGFRRFLFFILRFDVTRKREGITLLLVLLILTSFLSISLSIFNVVFTELRISGEIADSFIALYAADEAIERALYNDRDGTPFCNLALGANCYTESLTLSNNSCYVLRVDKAAINASTTAVTLRATGEYRCGPALLSAKRAFSVGYTQGRQ